MKLLFIQQDVVKYLGPMILSAVMKKKGHESDILIDPLEKDLMGEIKKINPDLIWLSITTPRAYWMKTIAKKIKLNFNIPLLVGGPHATFFPEIINLDYIDIVCMGEGEDAIKELLEKLENKEDITQINNLWVKKDGKIFKNPLRDLIGDLDTLPYADRTFYNKYSLLRNQNVDYFMTTRGCPYNCTFCFNKAYNELYKDKGKISRRRSVNNVIDEIKTTIKNNDKIKNITFYDDTFILGPREWFAEFFQRYKQEINLPFSVHVRANLVNEELIKMLKEAGCDSAKMGVESGNPYLREKVLKKGITNEQIINSVKIIKKYKIKLLIYNMLGLPGETLDTALETYELSYKLNPTYAWCSLMHPYPGTEIMDIAKQQNQLGNDYSIDDLDSSYFNTIPLNIKNKKEIYNLHKLFQFGNVFRIPKSVMKNLIKLPKNKIYEMIFKLNMGLGTKTIDNWSWTHLFRVASHSKDYISRKKTKD